MQEEGSVAKSRRHRETKDVHHTMLTSEEEVTTDALIHREAIHLEPQAIELIPDCLEHIFKYLSTRDKGRVSQVTQV